MASKDVKEILARMELDNERLQDTVRQIALNTEAMHDAVRQIALSTERLASVMVEMALSVQDIAKYMRPVIVETLPPPPTSTEWLATGTEETEVDQASVEGLVRQILVSEEGYKEVVYPSHEGGNPTAGIGHKLLNSEMAQWGSIGTPVPKAQLESWYAVDTATALGLAKQFIGDDNWGQLSPLRRALVICQCFQMGDLSDWQPTRAHILAKEWDDVRDHIMNSKWGRFDTPERAARMATMWVTDTLLDRYREVDTHQ